MKVRLIGVLVQNFCISLGVITGGALIGTLSVVITGQPPQRTLIELAERLKIWAMVAALGGTFESIRVIEMGLFGGQFQPDSLERLSLERDMRQVLRSLIGQAVRQLKPDTVMALLDKRIIAVTDKSYRVNVKAVVLAERVSFYLRVSVHSEDEDDEP